ncbi:MAG: hypothetical protein ABW161_01230 [Candidatus Thiodiazotropha sp.]
MAWRNYRILRNGDTFRVPPKVTEVGVAVFGPGGRCNHDAGGLGGGGGGGMAYGVYTVEEEALLTNFEVDAESSRFNGVLFGEAGGDSKDAHGGSGGIGRVVTPSADSEEEARWAKGFLMATGGHGGVGQRSRQYVSYGGGGGLGSFYGVGGSGGDGRLEGNGSMFGHGGGGGLGGDGGASLGPWVMEFVDRVAAQRTGRGSDSRVGESSGPGGGGGGGVAAGGDAWADYGFLGANRQEETLGGPGGGGGSFGQGGRGGVVYRPEMEDSHQPRMLASESPGSGGVGLRALGGEPRFYPKDYLSLYLPHEQEMEYLDETKSGSERVRVRRSLHRARSPREPEPAEGEEASSAEAAIGVERCPVKKLDTTDPGAMPTVFFTSGSGEGRTGMAPYLAWAARQLDGGGGSGANLCGAGHGGPGGGGGGAGRLPLLDGPQGCGGLAGHGGFGGGGGGGSTIYHEGATPGRVCVEGLPGGNGGVGGGGGGGGYGTAEGVMYLSGAGHGGAGGGGGGGPDSQGGPGFIVVYW